MSQSEEIQRLKELNLLAAADFIFFPSLTVPSLDGDHPHVLLCKLREVDLALGQRFQPMGLVTYVGVVLRCGRKDQRH